MIRNARQFEYYRRQLSSISAMKRRIENMVSGFAIDDRDVLKTIDRTIKEILDDLDHYLLTNNAADDEILGALRRSRNFPDLLIQARISLGWTQAEFARVLNLKPQQIYRYEKSNYANISVSNAQKIADTLSDRLEAEIARRRESKLSFKKKKANVHSDSTC